MAAHGFHEHLVVEAGEFIHSSQQFTIPGSTLRDAAAGGFGANEQPEAVWGKGAVAVGQDVDPFEIVPAHRFNNAVGTVAGDVALGHVDDESALGIEAGAWRIRGPGQGFFWQGHVHRNRSREREGRSRAPSTTETQGLGER